jgi:phosphoglycerol transferase MdoB-like AlkP superfamily enzyme
MNTITCYSQIDIAATKALVEGKGRKVYFTGRDNLSSQRNKLREACADLKVSPIYR